MKADFCCDCGGGDYVITAHRLRYLKQWYGYLPFDADGSTIITQLYRTFTVTCVDTVNGFTTVGSVTFDRLNGHISKSISTDAPDGIDTVLWPPTSAEFLSTLDPSVINPTQVGPFDLGDTIHVVTWVLSNPYTIEELEEDVDDLIAAYEAGDPLLPFDWFGNDVIIRYNEVDYNTCLQSQVGDPGYPHCLFTPFYTSTFHYFPESKAIYDTLLGGASPAVVFDVQGPTFDLVTFNTYSHDFGPWSYGHWEKAWMLVTVDTEFPPLCLTTAVDSSFETIADVCTVPVTDDPGGTPGDSLLLEEPATRATDQFTTTGFSQISATLCINCNQTAGGCPCAPL